VTDRVDLPFTGVYGVAGHALSWTPPASLPSNLSRSSDQTAFLSSYYFRSSTLS
jgi:hypothetical protein